MLSPTLASGVPLVFAQATRTWVSGVGDDVNPCSRTAPCKTFAGAISKTAAGGEIDALDPGGFGPVTITKAITLDGTTGGGFASINAATTTGVIINASPTTDLITLRNLSINGVGTGVVGVNILAAKDVVIENTEIFGFHAGNARGISDTRVAGGSLLVADSTISDNTQAGALISSSAVPPARISSLFDNVIFHRNGSGLSVQGSSVASVNDSSFSAEGLAGGQAISGQGNGTQINLNRSIITGSNTGIAMSGGATVLRLDGNMIVDNNSGVSISSGTVESLGNNEISGNGGGNTLPANSVIGPQ